MFSILDVWNPGEGPGGKNLPTDPSRIDGTTAIVIGVSIAVIIIVAVVVAVVLKNKKNANNN